MTIRFIESWKTFEGVNDHARRWTYQLGNGGNVTKNGLLINGEAVSYCNTHILQANRALIGFWFTPLSYAPSVTNSSFLHLVKGGETNNQNQIGLGCNPDGTVSVFRGPNFSGLGGTTLANGTNPMALRKRTWVELDVVFAAGTGGSLTLKLDDTTEIAQSGIDTLPVTSGGITGISLTAGAGSQHLVGGIYMGDGTEGFLGPCEFERLYPQPFADTRTAYTLIGGLFDSTNTAGGGGSDAIFTGPTYKPTTLHAVQAIRPSGGNAYPSIDWFGSAIPSGGITAPADSLYVEAMMSKSGVQPPFPGRRRFAALPG